jgi:hypothetical protein
VEKEYVQEYSSATTTHTLLSLLFAAGDVTMWRCGDASASAFFSGKGMLFFSVAVIWHCRL